MEPGPAEPTPAAHDRASTPIEARKPTGGIGPAALIVAAALLPYLTIPLAPRPASRVQAVGLLLLFLGAVAVGLARGPGGRARWAPLLPGAPQGPPRWLVFCTLAYGAAALLGAGVALASGNALGLLAGQLLAMGFLPLGVVAGLVLRTGREHAEAAAFPIALAVGTLLHLGHWALETAEGESVLRFIMGPSLSMTGLVPAGLAFAAALLVSGSPYLGRGARWGLLILALVFVVGSGTRGLWITAPLVLAGTLALALPRSTLRRAAPPTIAAGVVFLLLAAWGFTAARSWLTAPRPALLAEAAASGDPEAAAADEAGSLFTWKALHRRFRPFPAAEVPGAGVYRLRAAARSEPRRGQERSPEEEAAVFVQWLGKKGRQLGEVSVRIPASTEVRRRWVVAAAPAGTVRARIELESRLEQTDRRAALQEARRELVRESRGEAMREARRKAVREARRRAVREARREAVREARREALRQARRQALREARREAVARGEEIPPSGIPRGFDPEAVEIDMEAVEVDFGEVEIEPIRVEVEDLELEGETPDLTLDEMARKGTGERGRTWHLVELEMEKLHDRAALAPWISQLAFSVERIASLGEIFQGGAGADAESLGVRMAETRHLLERFRKGSISRKLFGHGLGAVFRLPPEVPSAARLPDSDLQNYTHNFYLFLIFKLGLVGSALVLAALGIALVAMVRRALALPHGPARSALAAAAAAWAGYLLFSLTSPEILNFRMAPLLGVLLALAAGAGWGRSTGEKGTEP